MRLWRRRPFPPIQYEDSDSSSPPTHRADPRPAYLGRCPRLDCDGQFIEMFLTFPDWVRCPHCQERFAACGGRILDLRNETAQGSPSVTAWQLRYIPFGAAEDTFELSFHSREPAPLRRGSSFVALLDLQTRQVLALTEFNKPQAPLWRCCEGAL